MTFDEELAKPELEPVCVDDIPGWRSIGSFYDSVLNDFLKSGHQAVRLKLDWPAETSNGEIERYANGIRALIRSRGIEVKVMLRRGEIYLVHDAIPEVVGEIK